MSSATCIAESTRNISILTATAASIAPPHHHSKRKTASGAIREAVVIDGLNVFFASRQSPKFENVLAIAADVIANDYDLYCVFDASTRYTVRDRQGSQHVKAYLHLLEHFSNLFIETTGGSCADEVILNLAEMYDARIISNDRYRDWINDFHFLTDRNRVIRVNTFKDILFVGKQRLRVDSDLRTAMSKLEELMSSQFLKLERLG
jgi:hypothetical protein